MAVKYYWNEKRESETDREREREREREKAKEINWIKNIRFVKLIFMKLITVIKLQCNKMLQIAKLKKKFLIYWICCCSLWFKTNQAARIKQKEFLSAIFSLKTAGKYFESQIKMPWNVFQKSVIQSRH